ncbi:hypothetical protein APHAL10511_002212 [Amanita phalloides]|nr:hypothetical protein APHAL10511_002212 [Amanita phalloides]
MGDPSNLIFVPASAAATPIDWTRVSEDTKKFLIRKYGYDWEKEEYKPLPATVGDLAKMFDESKFFGYFSPDILNVLMDISEFGLLPARRPHGFRSVGPDFGPAGPRFYMTYLDEVNFFLFAPGTRECVVGNSRSVEDKDDDEKKAIAQEFDVELEDRVSRGFLYLSAMAGAKLRGWDILTAESTLEMAQYAEALTSLPMTHPARRAFLQSALAP